MKPNLAFAIRGVKGWGAFGAGGTRAQKVADLVGARPRRERRYAAHTLKAAWPRGGPRFLYWRRVPARAKHGPPDSRRFDKGQARSAGGGVGGRDAARGTARKRMWRVVSKLSRRPAVERSRRRKIYGHHGFDRRGNGLALVRNRSDVAGCADAGAS